MNKNVDKHMILSSHPKVLQILMAYIEYFRVKVNFIYVFTVHL